MDSDRLSRGSERHFRNSTHLIPSAGSGGKVLPYNPWYMSWFVVLGTPFVILALGIALEVGTIVSSERGGFKVPPTNIFPLVSPQFLLSFVPVVIIVPLAFMWREIDWVVRWLQPYILLWKGGSPAEESLLLDYIMLGPFLGLFRASKYKHRIVFWSSVTALATYFFQTFAGSIFQLRQKEQDYSISVTSIKDLGLIPDVNQLNAFVAAAGFAEAAVYQSLPDPPFISKGWAVAQFTLPTDPGLNGTVSINTTGIQTAINCENPVNTSLNTTNPNSFELTSQSVEGCTVNVTYDPIVSSIQFGVLPVSCPGSSTNITLQPVMFWFFHNKTDGSPEVKTVFCAPSIKAYNVIASVNLNDRSLANVAIENERVPSNNVTGDPLAGQAYNGVIFNNSTNPFIQGRSLATKSSVSGAIFRFASQMPGGPQSSFDLPNGFLDITSIVYTQHLSVVAKSIYFVDANATLPAKMTSLVPILWIDPFPAHILAWSLILVGFFGIVLQVLHQRERRKVPLTTPPGSIGAVVSLTARSGFGELLLPYDDEAALHRKLRGLTFRLDRRTGAIVADDVEIYDHILGADDATISLLERSRSRDQTISFASSTELASQAASGYPPWKTPYDR
ncbi:hypothetical protein H2248_002002 [Termitomyces sp. 'cryptogamus']|nr:hypothetical protein H2248_002002 [Termitomyces sp. 'cryptogamus']